MILLIRASLRRLSTFASWALKAASQHAPSLLRAFVVEPAFGLRVWSGSEHGASSPRPSAPEEERELHRTHGGSDDALLNHDSAGQI